MEYIWYCIDQENYWPSVLIRNPVIGIIYYIFIHLKIFLDTEIIWLLSNFSMMELENSTSSVDLILHDQDILESLCDDLRSDGSSPIYSSSSPLTPSPTHLGIAPAYCSDVSSTIFDDVFEPQPIKSQTLSRSKLKEYRSKPYQDAKVNLLFNIRTKQK